MSRDKPIDIPAELAILAGSHDGAELARAATAVIASGDRQALRRLGTLLSQREFLARLDDLDVPSLKTRRLGRVMAALEQHPSPSTAQFSLDLAADETYLADPDRKVFLLRALAAVRPMSDEAAALFRDANAEGYFGADAILLANNGSPRALDLLGDMLADGTVPAARRTDCAHLALYPHRTEPPLLALAGHVLAGDLDDEVATAVIESIVDDEYARWFPPGGVPPLPPAWEEASTDALEQLLALGGPAEARPRLPAWLRSIVERTVARVRSILARRER